VRSERNSWNRNTTERITLIPPIFKFIHHELDVKKKAVTQIIWGSVDFFLRLTANPSLILSELPTLTLTETEYPSTSLILSNSGRTNHL